MGVRSSRGRDVEAGSEWGKFAWMVLGAGGLLTLLVLLFGSIPTAIVFGAVTVCVAQGLWRGGAEMAAFLVAMILGLLIGPLLGRGLEGAVGGVIGTGGLVNRFVSAAIGVVIVLLLVGGIGGTIARRFARKREGWAKHDRWIGGAMGLLEGVIVSLAILWIPLALEPVAQTQIAAGEKQEDEASSVQTAKRIVKFAGDVRGSMFGGIAEGTNPATDSRILKLANDFAQISRDPEAMASFLESDVIKRIRELSSVRQTIQVLEEDAELKDVVGEGVVTAEAVLRVCESQKVLEILDSTTVVQDLGPLADELVLAIADAKAKIKK